MKCDKVGFTKNEAYSILKIKDRKQWRKEIRAYPCPICMSKGKDRVWHLTSKSNESDIKYKIHPEWWEKFKTNNYELQSI